MNGSTPSWLFLGLTLIASPSAAAGEPPLWIGDPINGAKLYTTHCAACHGEAGRGGRTGVDLTDSGRLNLIIDDALFEVIGAGKGLKRQAEHQLSKHLPFLDIWDTAAYVRTLHMSLRSFFPEATRYVSKVYTIDKWGLERVAEATGAPLKDTSAAVFTFFKLDDRQDSLRFVPQDPILLDELKKDRKAGYLVFLPFETNDYQGEIGLAMDPRGQLVRLSVHPQTKGGPAMNRHLAELEGLGKKGQSEPFRVRGGARTQQLAGRIFPLYMRAMETVTMYDREERERTWADE